MPPSVSSVTQPRAPSAVVLDYGGLGRPFGKCFLGIGAHQELGHLGGHYGEGADAHRHREPAHDPPEIVDEGQSAAIWAQAAR